MCLQFLGAPRTQILSTCTRMWACLKTVEYLAFNILTCVFMHLRMKSVYFFSIPRPKVQRCFHCCCPFCLIIWSFPTQRSLTRATFWIKLALSGKQTICDPVVNTNVFTKPQMCGVFYFTEFLLLMIIKAHIVPTWMWMEPLRYVHYQVT